MPTKIERDAPSRRAVMLAASACVLALPLLGCGRNGAQAGTPSGEDNVLGDPNAPVTVIEYASITCPHCKSFHDQVFPELKARYIDTGKVRFVFRELPTAPTPLAMAGFLMARCAPEEKYFDVLDLLFERQVPLVQAYSAGGSAARDELLKIARPLGITDEQFEECIRDEAEIERIRRLSDEGFEQFQVSGTPTFVINGETYGAMSIEQFAEVIDPLLPAEG